MGGSLGFGVGIREKEEGDVGVVKYMLVTWYMYE